jgi:hypothetical protein
MEKFLFLDLDDTVFQTLRKCGDIADLQVAAYLRDGVPGSFCTPKQIRLLEFFRREMHVIPTTARNLDAFHRLNLAFGKRAILNHGGIILAENGKPDTAWQERMTHLTRSMTEALYELKARIGEFSERCCLPISIRIVSDLGMDFYVLIKHPEAQVDPLRWLLSDCIQPWITDLENNFYCHFNGNNLAILPTFLSKTHAVGYLREQLVSEFGEVLTFGMGDSDSDAGFMRLCDYAIIPRHCQLFFNTLAKI